jgi:NADPH-dependent glutamate synthase beta subunit-like oxidoreductase/glutamate synthase domain-containing protein 3/Pyruvate/2-oxoacid:ferredoxin oxidoreductase delta subunit
MEEVISCCRIHVGKIHYRDVNLAIRRQIKEGVRHFILENVTGQRYIGAGLDDGIVIEIYGVPGQDLGVFNGGATLIVHGNAQDGVGNTMNDGRIIVHGSVGDIPGHMVRNGKIYIKGSAGFRAGIMMKEYAEKHPVMIVGESIGDYAGEYMAGGTIVILGYSLEKGISPIAGHAASGMFGGTIYIRGEFSPGQLGEGAVVSRAAKEDRENVEIHLTEYATTFGLDLDRIFDAPYWVIRRAGQRPYAHLYVPSSKIARELKPVHKNVRPPCACACPVGIPNPIIIRKLKDGSSEEAFDIIDDYTPFRYSCCGLVCPGLCRTACTRNTMGEAVKIDNIARQYHPKGKVKVLEDPKSERITVIGAGPAGLTAAWHLARRGYAVDVYEKEKCIGGKLTHNIPEERLPRSDVNKDLERIRSLGIRFYTDSKVDAELFQRLRETYNVVIIAVGAQKPRQIGFRGEKKALTSFQFLRSVNLGVGDLDMTGKSVVIIGAGNVAMDVACECFRLSAESVTAVDVQKPAVFGKELERAMELGTRVLFPRFVEKYDGAQVYFKNGDILRADILIEAVGEIPELDFCGDALVYEKGSFTTNVPSVFVTGDVAAPGLVTHSVGMGKAVAEYVHCSLQGLTVHVSESTSEVLDKRKVNTLYFQHRDALFGDLDDCFSCGTCIQCDICVDNCPRGAIERVGENFRINTEICTGCGVCASVCPRGAITMESV